MRGRHPPNRKKARPTKSPTKKVSVKATKTQTKPDKPRTKSSGAILEKQFAGGKAYCNVVCRLGSICTDRALVDEIHRSVRTMKQIQLEAWHLLNLHTLRCLDNGLPLPDYSSPTFIDHICAGVATTPKTHLIARKDPELWNTICIYQAQREEAGLREVSNLPGYSTLKAQLRQQMVVSAGVMIREHFYKRLRLYVNIAFGGTTTQDMTKQQKKERKERISSIMKACFSTDTTVDPGAQQMRTMLTPEDCAWGEQFFPYSNRIKENGLGFYVRLLYKFQQKVEEHMKELPNEKGVRSFSLLPVSRSYLGGHITINASTLSGFYSRIKRIEQYEWTGVSLSAPSFQQHRWTVMRNAFSIDSFETRRPYSPLTKSEFCALAGRRQVSPCKPFVRESGYDGRLQHVYPFLATKDRRGVAHGVSQILKGKHRAASGSTWVRFGCCDRTRSRNARCVHCGSRGCRRSPRRQRCSAKTVSQKTPPEKEEEGRTPAVDQTAKASATEEQPRHRKRLGSRVSAHGFNRFRAWHEGQKRLHPRYKEALRGIPSFKISGYSQYLDNLQYFWRHVTFLLDFCAKRPFLKWRFFRKRMARVAVDAIAKRIVPTVSRTTCVAFGDRSRRSGIKGHAPSSVKGLRKALTKRAMVVSMDEYRTSMLCSQCHHTLSSVCYSVDTRLPTRKKRQGVVLVRNRAEVEFEKKKCHAVLRCDHKDCEARYWDRDVNAAINMLALLKSEVLGLGRMEPFRR